MLREKCQLCYIAYVFLLLKDVWVRWALHSSLAVRGSLCPLFPPGPFPDMPKPRFTIPAFCSHKPLYWPLIILSTFHSNDLSSPNRPQLWDARKHVHFTFRMILRAWRGLERGGGGHLLDERRHVPSCTPRCERERGKCQRFLDGGIIGDFFFFLVIWIFYYFCKQNVLLLWWRNSKWYLWEKMAG